MTTLAIQIRAEGLEITPGASGTLAIEVSNLGSVVDRYRCEIVGIPDAWVTVSPRSLELFPPRDGPVVAARPDTPPSKGRFTVTISPPRSPEATAGPLWFGAKVTSENDPSSRVVEEATAIIKPFGGLAANLRPTIVGGRSGASSGVELANQGNRPEEATLTATDPTDRLKFRFDPPQVTIPPGITTRIPFGLSAGSAKIIGGAENRTFTVTVRSARTDIPPVNLVGTFEHRALLPSGAPAAFAVLLALAMGGVALLSGLHLGPFEARNVASTSPLVSPAPPTVAPITAAPPTVAPPTVAPPSSAPPPSSPPPSPTPSRSPKPTPSPTPPPTPPPTPTPTPTPTPQPTPGP